MHTANLSAYSVECVVFCYRASGLGVILVRRDEAPFEGRWALPGCEVAAEKTALEAGLDVLSSSLSRPPSHCEQLQTLSAVDRDPTGRVVSTVYWGAVDFEQMRTTSDAACFDIRSVPKLPLDHSNVVRFAHEQLKLTLRFRPIVFALLPKAFSLGELQRLLEVVWETKIDKRNFRRSVLGMGILARLEGRTQPGRTRPSQLFRFDPSGYQAFVARGGRYQL